ncbi:hypothetical protein [Microbacterium sp.]|uniref:hypothetical protein n=1 Tax=Microbacterium sp. TaxID=51671 RepID=UPI003C22CB90
MISRVAAVAVALVLVVGMTTGCQPEPAPSPSGPIFANEDEAFAAAEQTYRAYVDALNQRRSDASSTPDPQSFLTGQALEVDIDTQQHLDQAGLALTGITEIASVSPVESRPDIGFVKVDVCLDSSGTRVVNDAGADVTPPDRQPISLITVDFLSVRSGLLIMASKTKVTGGC